jgi:2-methylcitrate dehydratase PrpD
VTRPARYDLDTTIRLLAGFVRQPRVEAITALDGAGTGELIGWGDRVTSPMSAAMLNSRFIQGFELDDYHRLAPCTVTR